ncbi:MAG: DUF4080 domain-containing protein, partial [Firmicutes bacterium]|nr:DUF4080 domain-containing protein [Bacillota bacterium]
MQILLVAINARYSHSNPALYGLKNNLNRPCEIIEFNINQPLDYMLGEVHRKSPDILGLSCYIWNRQQVLALANTFRKVVPNCTIIVGGPEAASTASQLLEDNPGVDYVLTGEGELAFKAFVSQLAEGRKPLFVPGLWYRDEQGKPRFIPADPAINRPDLTEINFAYTSQDLQRLKGRIIYYESSRGCPYTCGYCLSSTDQGVRFLPLDRVKKEISQICASGARLVKFVDRTFNCQPERAKELWDYLIRSTPKEVHFHFEIGADLLDNESLTLLKAAPKGKFQFEIGVQSTNPQVLAAVGRPDRTSRIAANVRELAAAGNIHLHLDLIAGLPLEDWASFAASFDRVFRMRPHRIQLGFLKVLPGTPVAASRERYGLKHLDQPPYEVLETNHLSYSELWMLKQIEELVETYGNSRRFSNTLTYLIDTAYQGSAFSFYLDLARHWVETGLYHRKHKARDHYDLLVQFLEKKGMADNEALNRLKLDYALSEQHSDLPKWAPQEVAEKTLRQEQHRLLKDPEFILDSFSHLTGMKGREMIKRTRLVEVKLDDT